MKYGLIKVQTDPDTGLYLHRRNGLRDAISLLEKELNDMHIAYKEFLRKVENG